MSNLRLTVGLIGYGYWGPNLLRNFFAHPQITVKYVSDLSQKNLNKVQQFYPSIQITKDFLEILNDSEVDAVILAVPTAFHFDIAKKALKAGKHVFVEKPMTQTVKQAKDLVTLSKKHKKIVCVDHPFVFSEPIRYIKQMIDTGELGKIYSIESTRMNLGLFQKEINVIDDLGPHDLSIIDYLLDSKEPERITAFGSRHIHDTQLEQAHINLQYKSGTVAMIHLSWLSPLKIRQFMIIGSKKMVVFDDTEPSEKIRVYDKGVEIKKDDLHPFQPFYRSGDVIIPKLQQTETLTNVVEGFVQTVLSHQKAINNVQAGARVVELLHKIQKKCIQSQK